MQKKNKNILQFLLIVSLIIILILLTPLLRESDIIVRLVDSYGYIAVFLLSIISGFNILVPVPPAIIGTLFIELGLNIVGVIITIIIGITIADLTAFYLGKTINQLFENRNAIRRIEKYILRYKYFHIFLILVWASFIPLPNEVILIPLAIIGYKFKDIVIPLLIGNVIGTYYFIFIGQSIFRVIIN